jgi:hypothetical protein
MHRWDWGWEVFMVAWVCGTLAWEFFRIRIQVGKGGRKGLLYDIDSSDYRWVEHPMEELPMKDILPQILYPFHMPTQEFTYT